MLVKGNTAKGRELLARTSRNEGYYLDDVYDKVSSAKQKAWRKCLEWCDNDGGTDFHIISHNSYSFSVAWEYTDSETGEYMTRIETSRYSYIVDGTR